MGLLDWLRNSITGPGEGLGIDELARRLKTDEPALRDCPIQYRAFLIPKRSGGTRRILAPAPPLKDLQRRILYRLLNRLRVHPCAVGFERGRSIVSNAVFHARQAVVVRMDVKDFFTSTRAERVQTYFQKIGWNRDAAGLVTRLVTHEGSLPQGAPSSPRLSNLLNHRLDARLAGVADRFSARYSRYADDLTFSFPTDEGLAVHRLIHLVGRIAADEGYQLHMKKKLHIRRRHDRQLVSGLVVNEVVQLPRETRRWLRAVEHRMRTRGWATLVPAQLAGWRSLQSMIERQTEGGPGA